MRQVEGDVLSSSWTSGCYKSYMLSNRFNHVTKY